MDGIVGINELKYTRLSKHTCIILIYYLYMKLEPREMGEKRKTEKRKTNKKEWEKKKKIGTLPGLKYADFLLHSKVISSLIFRSS